MTDVSSQKSDVSGQRLGVMLSQFPRYDEAFILRELAALAQTEPELVIFSLRPCRDRVIHAQAKALQPRTVYAPFLWSAAVWASHAYFLRRAPRAYWGALAWIISRHWNHPAILVKTLILFPKTVHFARLAQEDGLRHLHAFWATYPATSAMIISRLTGIPYSLSGHAHDLYTVNPTLAETIHAARFVVTCTEENKRHLAALVNGSPPIVVSYHGVDLQQFAALPKPADGPCRLLAVGSLLPCKGLETLIAACRLLRERGVVFSCTLAGGGPLERKLRALIRRYGLDADVTITGYVSQEVVAGVYQQAHLFALPLVSRIHWGIPNVLIEALATKTPVICCDLPSMKELVVHDESGWIIPEGGPAALAQAVETLWRDAPRRARIAETGWRRVTERFALERTGEALRAVFRDYAGASTS